MKRTIIWTPEMDETVRNLVLGRKVGLRPVAARLGVTVWNLQTRVTRLLEDAKREEHGPGRAEFGHEPLPPGNPIAWRAIQLRGEPYAA